MRRFICALVLIIPGVVSAKQCLSDYPAATLTQGNRPGIHPAVVFVDPPYAGFDPCNETVQLKLNEKSDAMVLVLHGAGGADNSQANVADRFYRAGYSVIRFDAFKMNRLNKEPAFWVTAVHAGSTSRMLYFSGLAALHWVQKNHPERSKKLVVYGFSMGGMAAINLAATEGLDAVTTVIAEAPGNAGMGLPDKLLKPVHVFYGDQDNFGGLSIDEYLWKRRSPCLWNSPIENTPPGNTANCSYAKTEKGRRAQTVEEYVEEQKKKGADIHFRLVQGAGHGMFNLRGLETATRTTPSGIKFYSTTGSKPGVADIAFSDVLSVIK